MNILIIHPYFPGQFSHLASALVQAGHSIVVLTTTLSAAAAWKDIRLVSVTLERKRTQETHPWLSELESKTAVGEAFMRAALGLRAEGFVPAVILAHSAWGESLFIKDVWPQALLGVRGEYFKQPSDAFFDQEFAGQDGMLAGRLRMQQLAQRLQFEQADLGMVAARWQVDSFPKPWRDRLSVVPEGIDTDAILPKEDVSLTLNGQLLLTRRDEVITFACRELMPQAGFHVFMRALPAILQRRSAAHVLIAGGESGETGGGGGRSWCESLIAGLKTQVSSAEWMRVHFVGRLAAPQWIGLLQLSSVHAHLSYPSVASAGLLEAMSVGCAVVGSRTAPVEAAIMDGETGTLVDFFDSAALADEICRLLDAPEERARLGRQAREFVRDRHEARTVCLAAQLEWFEKLLAMPSAPALNFAELRSSLHDILALL